MTSLGAMKGDARSLDNGSFGYTWGFRWLIEVIGKSG